jgi:hypothetical protein
MVLFPSSIKESILDIETGYVEESQKSITVYPKCLSRFTPNVYHDTRFYVKLS